MFPLRCRAACRFDRVEFWKALRIRRKHLRAVRRSELPCCECGNAVWYVLAKCFAILVGEIGEGDLNLDVLGSDPEGTVLLRQRAGLTVEVPVERTKHS